MQLQVETQIYRKDAIGNDINTLANNAKAKYAVSSTEAATAAKIAIFQPNVAGWSLFNGAEVFVKFDNAAIPEPEEGEEAQAVALTLTLKTSALDTTAVAHPIKDSEGNTLPLEFYWDDNSTVHFMYDGTNWRALDIVSVTKYNSLVTTIEEFRSTVGTQTTEISGSLDALETRVTNNESTIEQHAEQIALKVNSEEIYEYVDDGLETEVEARNAAITETANGITQTVSAVTTKVLGNYAICSTPATSMVKTATITPAVNDWILYIGAVITVKFVNGNTNSVPQLNINGTGAAQIFAYSGSSNLTEEEYTWEEGTTITFFYDGDYWRIQDSTELTRISTAETKIEQTENNILIKATKSNADPNDQSAAGQSIIQSLINVAPEGVVISADKIEIDGTAIFNNTDFRTAADNAYDALGAAADVAATIPVDLSDLTDTTNMVSSKADKSAAVAKTQRIYYRSNSETKPTAYPTAWVTREDNVWNNGSNIANGWSRKVTPISNGANSNVTKYLYLWTATQKQLVNGNTVALTATDIALDDSTTVIDGGKIITNSVTADKITADNITSSNGYSYINLASGQFEYKNTNSWSTTTNGIKWDGSALTIKGAVTATSLSTGTKTASTTGNGFYVDSGGNIYVGNGSTNNFTVTAAGEITAKKGTIGGFTLTNTQLYAYYNGSSTPTTAENGLNHILIQCNGSNDGNSFLKVQKRSSTSASWETPFYVTHNGYLYATNAYVSGTIVVGDDTESNVYTTTEVDGVFGGIDERIVGLDNSVSDQLQTMQQNLDKGLDDKATSTELTEVSGIINEYLGANGYIKMTSGGLIVGSGEFNVAITGQMIGFRRNSTTLAYIGIKDNVTKLFIEEAELINEFKMGNFVWKPIDGQLVLLATG